MKLVVLLAGGLMLASCGDSSLGGGVSDFTTVKVSAAANPTRLEMDVITNNSCTNGTTSGGTIITDFVDVTVTSTAMFATGTPLDVSVDSYTIYYTPKNPGVPAVTPLTGNLGQIVKAGTPITLSIDVGRNTLKQNLINLGLTPCSTTNFQYDVSIMLHVLEIGSAKRADVPAIMTVQFLDSI